MKGGRKRKDCDTAAVYASGCFEFNVVTICFDVLITKNKKRWQDKKES